MPTSNTQRLTERYKAAISDFHKNDSCHESRQELETLRWEEQLPLVYRLRARAVLTGDFIIGCWRAGEEEHRLAAEQEAYDEISAAVSSSSTGGLEVEDREVETCQPADHRVVAVDSLLAECQSRDGNPCCTTQRDVVSGSLRLFAGFGAEPTTEPSGDMFPFGSGFGSPTKEPTPEPTKGQNTERRKAGLHILR
jgi:hypothetical protein